MLPNLVPLPRCGYKLHLHFECKGFTSPRCFMLGFTGLMLMTTGSTSAGAAIHGNIV